MQVLGAKPRFSAETRCAARLPLSAASPSTLAEEGPWGQASLPFCPEDIEPLTGLQGH